MRILHTLMAMTSMVSADLWEDYKVGEMQCHSVTGGPGDTAAAYDKVVILLHGGGMNGMMWKDSIYDTDWLGDITGYKYVFPDGTIADDTGTIFVWYESIKNGCGLNEGCGYNIDTIKESARQIEGVINYEKGLAGIDGDAKKVYLAGFSQGGQMTTYMQIAHLDYPIGGNIVFDGYPLPPLVEMTGHTEEEARANATYYGDDMRWMFYHGSYDLVFNMNDTQDEVTAIWDVLGIQDTLKIYHIQCGLGHQVSQGGIDMMKLFINGQDSDDTQEYCPPSNKGTIMIVVTVLVVLACSLACFCCYKKRKNQGNQTFKELDGGN